MSMRSWPRLALLTAALGAIAAAGCETNGTSATGGPGKPAEETYAKKLVGVGEGTEEMAPGEKPETVTVEFKADGGFKVAMGPFDMAGTWKLAKEEGKTVTVDTEVSFPNFGEEKGPGKTDKKVFSIVFEDANAIVMTQVGGKPDPKKLKRKP
jgi:hypothetical protein